MKSHRAIASLLVLLLVPGFAFAGKPEIDPSWVDGQIVYMIGPHLIPNPNPNLYAHAEELYLGCRAPRLRRPPGPRSADRPAGRRSARRGTSAWGA